MVRSSFHKQHELIRTDKILKTLFQRLFIRRSELVCCLANIDRLVTINPDLFDSTLERDGKMQTNKKTYYEK